MSANLPMDELARDGFCAGYAPLDGVYDELMTPDLAVRPHWQALISALEREASGEVRAALIGAIGQVAGSRDGNRRQAVVAVLSRIGLEAALRIDEGEIDAAIEEEIARLVGEAAADDGGE